MPIAVAVMPFSLIGASKQRLAPYFCLQMFGDFEHAAEIADVFAEREHVRIAFHHGVER
jgi:hypothetical protein